jgi:hypothetical protein
MDGSGRTPPRWMHPGRGDSSGRPVDIVELGASPRSTLPDQPQKGTSEKRRRFFWRKAASPPPPSAR